jgi:KUP system potassium uptake protein
MAPGSTSVTVRAPRRAGSPLAVTVEQRQEERGGAATGAVAASGAARSAGIAALTLGALGVVFGDIGTSPLYALAAVFSAGHHAVRPTEASVYGVISVVVWSVTIIVSLKYVTFIMRADNEGEGGILALIARIRTVAGDHARAKVVLVALGVFGASLFYGDGMITPAISVLSAVEGMEVVEPGLASLVVPITLVILTGLFVIQRLGTGTVGRAFGPVMAVWFAVLALTGLREVVRAPGVLRALSPTYGIEFFLDQGGVAFLALGSIVLTVTGAEALYADMGHFGRPPIRRAWFAGVFPALTLNYMGQGALILRSPRAIANPFFLLVPHWGRIPMVLLATGATVIASQAVISGAFSVTRQAVRLGFLPRLTIRHTSAREIGQVYVPAVNWGVFAAVVALVVGFGSSAHLASAYGIAVTGTLAIDTILFFFVVRALWRRPLWVALAGAAAFLTVDLAFLSANLAKVVHGGWFPLAIALAVFTVLTTWSRGREIVTRRRTEEEGPLRAFVEEVHALEPPVYRAPGGAVFLNANAQTTPLALRANVEHNHALHESVLIVSVETTQVPHVPEDRRLAFDDLGYADDGITHVSARFGFLDTPDVPRALRLAAEHGPERAIDVDRASYFLSRITIVPTRDPVMPRWRKRLFVAISRNAADPIEFFGLPVERTVIMGSHIEF